MHSQLSHWKSLADDKEARLEAAAAQLAQLESELRQAVTRAEAAATEVRLQHAQEREQLQAQLEEKERELEAAQEGVEAAQRLAADRDRQEASRADVSADQVRSSWGVRGRGSPAGLPVDACLEPTGCVCMVLHSSCPAHPPAHLQASQVVRELEAARAELAQIRQQQEAERGRVKKAIAEMRRKIDG